MQNVGTLKLHWFETIMFNDVTLQHLQLQHIQSKNKMVMTICIAREICV